MNKYIFVPTLKCNLNCTYCYNNFQYSKVDEQNWNIIETIKSIILKNSQLKQTNYSFIINGGEITELGYKTLVDICSLLTEDKNLKSLILKTNLVDFDDNFFSVCKDNGVIINASYDGPKSLKLKNNEDISKKIRNKILELKDKYIPLVISTVLIPINPVEALVNDLIDLSYNVEVYPSLFYIYEQGLKDLGYNNISEYYQDWIFNGIPLLAKNNIIDITTRDEIISYLSDPMDDFFRLTIYGDGFTCYSPLSGRYFKLGNINNDNFIDIFNSKGKEEIFKKIRFNFDTICSNCISKQGCYTNIKELSSNFNFDMITSYSMGEIGNRIINCDFKRILTYFLVMKSEQDLDFIKFYLQ